MSEPKNYASAIGFVQFDVKTGESNNKPVRYVRIRAAGSQKMVDVTVWDQHSSIPLAKGDAILVEGEIRQRRGQKDGVEVVYNNLSARLLVHLGSGAGSGGPGVVNAKPAAAEAEDDCPF